MARSEGPKPSERMVDTMGRRFQPRIRDFQANYPGTPNAKELVTHTLGAAFIAGESRLGIHKPGTTKAKQDVPHDWRTGSHYLRPEEERRLKDLLTEGKGSQHLQDLIDEVAVDHRIYRTLKPPRPASSSRTAKARAKWAAKPADILGINAAVLKERMRRAWEMGALHKAPANP